jgi:hypothetical protein
MYCNPSFQDTPINPSYTSLTQVFGGFQPLIDLKEVSKTTIVSMPDNSHIHVYRP